MRIPFGRCLVRAWRIVPRGAATTIALLAAPLVHPAIAQVPAGTAVVTGRITDARSSQGVPGATVQVEGTRLGAVTGEDGRYRIVNVPAGTHTIRARRIGYASAGRPVSVVAGGTATLDLALEAAVASLDEVVVTGTAGGEQRRSIGNAVSTINADEAMSKSAAQSVSTLIGARAPGVIIAPSTGRLGAGPSIQIRGRSSIGLDNSPLLYVDGVRVNNATTAGPVGVSGRLGGQASNVAGRLNDINPDDIESIEIIKGPAAATIYGTEAANGVIQIITKKGSNGRAQTNLRVEDGLIKFLNAENRVPTNYDTTKAGEIVAWNGVKSEAARGTPIFRTGQTRTYDLALSGGRDVVRYYASGAYQNDYGIEPNNSLRQFTFHANLNVSPSDKVEVGTSVNFVDLSSHLGADVGVSALLGAIAGHGELFPAARGFYPGFPPEVPQTLYDNAQGVTRFTGSTTVSHRPTDWFTQRLIVGIDQTGDDSRAIEHFAGPDLAKFIGSVAAGGSIGQTLRHNTIISADYAGTVKANISKTLSTTSSIGGQFFKTELNSSFLGGTGFPGKGVETVSAVSQPATSTQTQTINTTIGAYGQEQLGWNDRLFLTGALRVDNNSAFGSQLKWVTYPKVSLAWVVNEEPLWRENQWVNSLKLRAAYGESGRQPAAFTALRTYSPAQGPGGTSAVTPNSIGNANLKPERGKETELGFDSQLFSRLSLDFTYFNKKTFDEIINQPVAPSSGFSGSQYANLGRVDNHGIELLASLQAITRSDFSWEVTANYATNRDVIRDLGGIGGVVVSAGQTNVVGGPIGGIYTKRVVAADWDATAKKAINVLCDGGAGKPAVACATAPFVFIGTPTPSKTGSLANTFWFGKRIRLYGLFDFKRGYRVQNQNELIRCLGLAGAPLCRSNWYPLEYDPVYLAEHSGTALAQGITDQYYQSGDFVKLREVSVTYTVPERLLHGFSRASVTFAGRDLHTWTKYAGIDPEVNANNIATSASTADQGLYPPLTRFIASINLTF
jgi:TonB-linked SusC/RagA family outer membrane protein